MTSLSFTDFLDKIYNEGMTDIEIYESIKERTDIFNEKLLSKYIAELNDYCNDNLILSTTINKLNFSNSIDFIFPNEDYSKSYIQDLKISNFFQYRRNKHKTHLENLQKKGIKTTADDMYEIEFCTIMEEKTKQCTSIKNKIEILIAYPEVSIGYEYNSLIKLSNLLERMYILVKSNETDTENITNDYHLNSKRKNDNIIDCHQISSEVSINSVFLSNKVNKIDFVRVINCLCELGFFVDSNEKKSSKKEVFRVIGLAINKDFTSFNQELSSTKNAASSDQRSLLQIFEVMQNKQKEIITKKE